MISLGVFLSCLRFQKMLERCPHPISQPAGFFLQELPLLQRGVRWKFPRVGWRESGTMGGAKETHKNWSTRCSKKLTENAFARRCRVVRSRIEIGRGIVIKIRIRIRLELRWGLWWEWQVGLAPSHLLSVAAWIRIGFWFQLKNGQLDVVRGKLGECKREAQLPGDWR